MNMLRLLCWADALTIANLSCGVSAIFAAIQGHPEIGAGLIALAVVWDSLDGKVAGWTHRSGREFGKQLDSLADLVSFGVSPACLFFTMSEPSWLAVPPLLFFVACGMLRLARYNISTSKGFEGVPITVNGVLFPLLYLLSVIFPPSLSAWPLVFLAMGLLMASSLKVHRLF
ncbi:MULTISPECIES: CDP-diacylglycerol--serine O-phosphatidyltransferase [Methylococcus]|uniref:CDP-diacylglycerol--serine O-phosphatidyltransferase n=1 Tax=Methylococcus capsulatus TaxID=414 RepID=A0ABZ2F389_METCP|nr:MULTISPECIES: CDP-diacylglycerol--serine O-phosphatidyltransferase [Methylococcus]MDF9392191.1 CDP-diacylglycerol--serine O-phosphatidyltransferase [Methylococcus capsulatus]